MWYQEIHQLQNCSKAFVLQHHSPWWSQSEFWHRLMGGKFKICSGRYAFLTLLPFKCLKFEGSTEYSVSIHSFLWTISKKLVPKSIPTFGTWYLYGCWALADPRHWVLPDQMSKGRPGGRVLIFCLTMEEFISTIGTNIYSFFKVISKFFPRKPTTEWHLPGSLSCWSLGYRLLILPLFHWPLKGPTRLGPFLFQNNHSVCSIGLVG